jgi:hypothetical protein
MFARNNARAAALSAAGVHEPAAGAAGLVADATTQPVKTLKSETTVQARDRVTDSIVARATPRREHAPRPAAMLDYCIARDAERAT